jgi:hypothetical protein
MPSMPPPLVRHARVARKTSAPNTVASTRGRRSVTGLSFAYRQSGSATLSGEDPADLRDQIRNWLGRHIELD